MTQKNYPKGFSKLNLEELEICAAKWAKKHDVIEKISLYIGDGDSPKYIFIVTVPSYPNLDKSAKKRLNENVYLLKKDGNYVESISDDKYVPIPKDNTTALVNYYNWALEDCRHVKADIKSVYNDLESVYKGLEADGRNKSEFINEWMWFNINPDDKDIEDNLIENYDLVLVDSKIDLYLSDLSKPVSKVKLPGDKISQDIIGFMNNVRPEIELIYKAVKEGEGGFHSVGERYVALRMNDALNYFKEYKDKFEIIKEEDIQNEMIFKTSSSQYARTVKGRLLQTILKRKGLGNHSHSKLFTEYQKQRTIKL